MSRRFAKLPNSSLVAELLISMRVFEDQGAPLRKGGLDGGGPLTPPNLLLRRGWALKIASKTEVFGPQDL